MVCICNGFYCWCFWKGWNLIFVNCIIIMMVCLCFGGWNKLMYIVYYFVLFLLVLNIEIILKLFMIFCELI